jgi:hypothetical protein
LEVLRVGRSVAGDEAEEAAGPAVFEALVAEELGMNK